MNERSILIVDSDQKNLKVLDTSFSEASFVTAIANSDNEALSILETDSFYIVLCDLSAPSIDGYKLLKEIQRSPVRDGCHVVFTSTKSDIWNRVKSIKLGAKDFIVKPVHAAEVVARVNMLICRLQRNEENVAVENSQFSGRLEDLAVMDLVEIFGAEKKTGVLTVHNENGHSGQVICYQGQVISANMQSLRSEEAIYKMMHWNRGRFSMSFTDVPFYDEFTISNMGLLLQGAKRMDLRNELLKQLPSLDAIVITTSNFKKITSQKEMNAELHEFLKLFDGERTLGRIIDDSHENEIVTLKRIVKLYKLGFLYVLRNFSKGSPLQLKKLTIRYLGTRKKVQGILILMKKIALLFIIIVMTCRRQTTRRKPIAGMQPLKEPRSNWTISSSFRPIRRTCKFLSKTLTAIVKKGRITIRTFCSVF